MLQDRYWILLGKKNSGEATPEELSELDALPAPREAAGEAGDWMDKVWMTPLRPVPDMQPNRNVWYRIQKSIYAEEAAGTPARITQMRRWLVAATLLIIAGTAAFFYLADRRNQKVAAAATAATPPDKVATQPGSKTRVELPDGTQVWLNASSQLTYTGKSFGSKDREVSLSGEAFFDVAKNERIPFIIHTREITITVLGTAFNVRAYPKEHTVETALIRGLVEITTRRDPDRKIMLKPDEKLIVPVDIAPVEDRPHPTATSPALYSIVKLSRDTARSIPETVWMKTRLEFDNETLEELAPKMESWYNIRLRFRDNALRKRRFSGVVEKETLTQTLDAMKLSGNFTYEIKGNEVWLKGN